MWDAVPRQMDAIEKEVGRTAQLVDSCASRRSRRMLQIWVLKRVIGRPKECAKCRGRPVGPESTASQSVGKTSYEHVQECMGVNPTSLLRSGQVVEALHAVIRACRYCLGWSTEVLEAEVPRERKARERRELERQQARDGFTAARGAHAYWRYFAPTRRSE